MFARGDIRSFFHQSKRAKTSNSTSTLTLSTAVHISNDDELSRPRPSVSSENNPAVVSPTNTTTASTTNDEHPTSATATPSSSSTTTTSNTTTNEEDSFATTNLDGINLDIDENESFLDIVETFDDTLEKEYDEDDDIPPRAHEVEEDEGEEEYDYDWDEGDSTGDNKAKAEFFKKFIMDSRGENKARGLAKAFCVRAYELTENHGTYEDPTGDYSKYLKRRRLKTKSNTVVYTVLTEDLYEVEKGGCTGNWYVRRQKYIDKGVDPGRLRVVVDFDLTTKVSRLYTRTKRLSANLYQSFFHSNRFEYNHTSAGIE